MTDPLSVAFGLPDLLVAGFMALVARRQLWLIKRDGLP